MSSHIVLSIRALSRTSDLCPAEWAEWPVEPGSSSGSGSECEGGGRPDRSSEGGGLWQTPGTEQRREGTRGWEHGTSLPSHSGSDCWEDWTLARLHWHTGHTPPTITRAPHTGAGVAGAHYDSLGVSRSRRIVLGCCHKWWRWFCVKQKCSATTTNSYPVNPFKSKVLLVLFKCRGKICWKD